MGNETHFIFKEKFNKLYLTILTIAICIIMIDAFVEFKINSSSFFLYKDLVNLSLIFLAIVVWYYNKINSSLLLLIIFYSVLFSIIISLPFRLKEGFLFESYFLKTEIVMIIITFAVGVLVRPIHMVITIIINVIFILFCITLTNQSYSLDKFFFYTVFISGSCYAGYKVHLQFLELNKQILDANKLIVIQNEILNKTNQFKDELMKVFGHDLKTPFNQMITITDLMKDAKNDDLDELKNLIKESAIEGNKLLESLLHWVKINKEIEKHYTSINLYQVANNISKLLYSNYQSKKIIIENKINPLDEIITDLSIVETIFRNFISNSIKFSNPNSKIIIQSKNYPDTITISIMDFGIGMSKKTLDSILLNDNVLSTNGTNNEKGSGLGIGICFKLIREIHGKISIKSELDQGTTVEILIPKIK